MLARTLLENSRNEDGHELERQPELSRILNNCRDVLSHLESFVDKYSVLDPAARSPGDVSVRDTGPWEIHRDAGHEDADDGNASRETAASNMAPKKLPNSRVGPVNSEKISRGAGKRSYGRKRAAILAN